MNVTISHPTDRPNFSRVTVGELVLHFSYETVIAFHHPSTGLAVSENLWGPTTGKHIGAGGVQPQGPPTARDVRSQTGRSHRLTVQGGASVPRVRRTVRPGLSTLHRREPVMISTPQTPSQSGTWVGLAGPGTPGLAIDPTQPVIIIRERVTGCSCARNRDGSVTTMLCSQHAESDPCATYSAVTGKRRRGSIVKGRCSHCGWTQTAERAA